MKTPSDSLRGLCTLTLLSLLAFSPNTVAAHGGPPAALGLLAANPEAEVMLLNEGIALKRTEGWSYLCPSLWGEIMLASGKFPLARSADAIETFVPGGEDLFVLRNGELTAQQRPEYRRNAMIALANDAKYVYGLHITTVGERSMSEVVRLNADEPRFFPSEEYWGSITADADGVYIAGVPAANQLVLATLDKEGNEVSRATAMLDVTVYEVQLHALAGHVYVTATDGTTSLVGYFDGGTWKEVLREKMSIVGPQTSPDGTLWVAVGGALGRLKDGAVEPVDETRFITCLEQWNDWHYVCVGNDLHRLTESGVGEQVFQMQGLLGTDPKLISAEAKDYCAQQWTLYTIDATRSGLMFAEWPSDGSGTVEPATADPGSAGAAGGSAPGQTAGAGAAGAKATAGAGSDGMAEQASPQESSGGCSVTNAGARANDSVFALIVLAIGGCFFARRARKG